MLGLTSSNWLVVPIVLPLAAATLALLVGKRYASYLGLFTAFGILLSVAALGLTVLEEGTIRYELGGWEAPIGINLYADGLAVFMLLMTGVVGAAVSAYAIGYFTSRQDESGVTAGDSGDRSGSFWVLWMFLWSSLNGLFLSADAFNLYVTLEIMGLSAAGLITLERRRLALSSGMRYLLVTLLGSLAYLMGVALLYGAFGALDLATLGELMYPGATTWSALALITLGMALKTGLFPLHFWVPAAYSNAISPASALLAGLVGKASFYLLLRMWFDVFDGGLGPAAGRILGLLGAVAIVWGAVMALRQARLKTLLAYSSVSQIGYLFLLFSLATTASWGLDAWSGGAYHAFSHALAKAAMFMAAGAFIRVLGHDDLDRMRGVAQQMPLAAAAFALGGVTLMGLPPTGGFTAKWLLVSASLESGQWWLGAVLLSGGILAALYVLRFLNPALIQVKVGPVPRPPTLNLQVIAFVLAFLSFFLALFSAPLLELLRVGAPFGLVVIVGAP